MSASLLLTRLSTLLHLLKSSVDNDYIGEAVNQYEHALQAAHFARKYLKDNSNQKNDEVNQIENWTDEQIEIIIGALFHDIGHSIALSPPSDFDPYATPTTTPTAGTTTREYKFMDEYGAVSHEVIGARYLATLGFSANVCAIVAAHVDVKRYLCATDPSYFAKLSPASRKTLEYQGGPMNDAEVEQFNSDPLKEKKLIVRYCDELAKQVNLEVVDLSYYIPMIIAHVQKEEQVQAQKQEQIRSLECNSNKQVDFEEESKEITNSDLLDSMV